jgi:antitoxin component YwqK of YwqJK toxin-antitoxin module
VRCLILILLTCCAVAFAETYESYADTFPSGKKREQGKRKFLGIICGVPRFSYDGLVESWYEDGVKESAINYLAGERHGVAENWFPNGKLKYRVTWSKDKRDGPFVVAYDNGKIASKGIFKNEHLESAEFYDRDGKLVTRDDWCLIGKNRPFWE